MNFTLVERNSNEFIISLTQMLSDSFCLKNHYLQKEHFNTAGSNSFKKCLQVLNFFLNRKENFELEVLTTLQNLFVESDGAFLSDIFQIVYNEKILNERTFIKWKLMQSYRNNEEKILKRTERFFKKTFPNENIWLNELNQVNTNSNQNTNLALILSYFDGDHDISIAVDIIKVMFFFGSYK